MTQRYPLVDGAPREPGRSRATVLGVVAFLLFVLSASPALAQYTVGGRVLDATGEPLIGVNVLEVGTTAGTTTDVDGAYSLQVASPTATLEFRYIGYVTKREAVANRSQLDLRLAEDVATLGDVVVVGYGTQVKQRVTSAISRVDGEELARVPVPGLDQALQGRAAGVQVTKNTGAPGGGVSIRVRGTSSLLSGQEPLYVIDGVPINNTPSGSNDIGSNGVSGDNRGQAGNETINPLAGIAVEDIESIEILKDAASASIYGARAANGVVLITTKRGKPGPPTINFSTYGGVGFLYNSNRYDLLDATGFQALVNEGRFLANRPPIYTAAPASNTDWQDAILRAAPMYNANLALRGGSESMRYNLSLGYFDQEGIMVNSAFERYNAKVNLDFDLNPKLKAGTNILLSRSVSNRLRNNGNASGSDAFNNNAVYGPSLLASALRANPGLPVRNPDASFTVDTLNLVNNPVALAEAQNLLGYNNRGILNAFVEYTPVEGLRLRGSLGADIRDERTEYIYPPTPGIARGGSIYNGQFTENLWIAEGYADYQVPIPGEAHEWSVLAGASTQSSRSRGFAAQVAEVQKPELTSINSGIFQRLSPLGFQDYGIVSYFARSSYALQGKYLLTATVRRDGSSRFGPQRRFGTFPSASVGWLIMEEPFFREVRALSNLKVRASYGITGNDQLGDTWEWRGTGGPLPINTGNYLGDPTLLANDIDNRDFTWETTRQLDIGLEVGFFDGRIDFVADYYDKTTDDLLFPIELPYTTGFTSRIGNLGTIQNQGLEFALRTVNVRRDGFEWSTSANITFNRNKVLELANGGADYNPGGGVSIARVGEPISYQAVRIAGIDPADGDWLPINVEDGPDQPEGTIDRRDVVIVGSPLPKHFGGFDNTLRYKGLSLQTFFTWSYGNLVNNVTRSFVEATAVPSSGLVGSNIRREAFEQRWVAPGDTDAQYRGIDVNNRYDNVRGLPIDVYLEDGSFLRLRTVTLGYQLSPKLNKRLRTDQVSLYLTGANLLTFTKYSGYDPEVNHNNVGTNIAVGYDNGTYPNSQTVTFGLNATF